MEETIILKLSTGKTLTLTRAEREELAANLAPPAPFNTPTPQPVIFPLIYPTSPFWGDGPIITCDMTGSFETGCKEGAVCLS